MTRGVIIIGSARRALLREHRRARTGTSRCSRQCASVGEAGPWFGSAPTSSLPAFGGQPRLAGAWNLWFQVLQRPARRRLERAAPFSSMTSRGVGFGSARRVLLREHCRARAGTLGLPWFGSYGADFFCHSFGGQPGLAGWRREVVVSSVAAAGAWALVLNAALLRERRRRRVFLARNVSRQSRTWVWFGAEYFFYMRFQVLKRPEQRRLGRTASFL